MSKTDLELAQELQSLFDAEIQNGAVPPPKHTRVPADPFQATIRKVCGMANDATARKLADNHGLAVQTVSWEDSARDKNSAWGPCISDMTLQVNGSRLPVIRSPNFTDLTWDVEVEKIPLVIGNERGEMLRTVTLKEYLRNFRDYLHDSTPSNWKGSENSLLADRDSHVIMSAQACFLPVPQAGEAKFNVCLYNYQSFKGNPAVLAIVATSNGTSAQIVEGDHGGQKLFFNKDGQRASFIGQRLGDHRAEQGLAREGAMTESEKQQNMILIIQVPLKVPPMRFSAMNAMQCMVPNPKLQMPSRSRGMKSDVEDVIVKVGDAEGPFAEIGGLEIERDPKYPIRVTLQYYKATSNGVIDESNVAVIAKQITEARKFATDIGSLVVGGDTNRPTEWTQTKLVVPGWWEEFWLTHRTLFPSLTKDKAAETVFKGGRFANASMADSRERILDILTGAHAPQPSWNVL